MGQLQSIGSATAASHDLQQSSESLQDGHMHNASSADLDIYAERTTSGMLVAVKEQKQPEEDEPQATQVLLDVARRDVIDRELVPSSVLLHVYDVREGPLQHANNVLAFSTDKAAVGGAFHVGVEVFGNEWCYGTRGLRSDPPRSITGHVYRCSLLLGETDIDEEDFAAVLCEMCSKWKGVDYRLLGHNCCSFAHELCERLHVGPLPDWVDRFARMLNKGKTVVEVTKDAVGSVGSIARGATSKVIEKSTQVVTAAHCRVFRVPDTDATIEIRGHRVFLSVDSVSESPTSPSPKAPEEAMVHLEVRCLEGHVMEGPLFPGEFEYDNWKCDYKGPDGSGCKNGITDFGQTRGMVRWKCGQCNFDVCDTCAEYLKQANAPPRAPTVEPVYIRAKAAKTVPAERRKKSIC